MLILIDKITLRYFDYSHIQHLFSPLDGVERRIIYLSDEEYDILKQYPNLNHYHIVSDTLLDTAFGIYTDGLKKLIKYGTVLE
jgi:hypothetical protein